MRLGIAHLAAAIGLTVLPGGGALSQETDGQLVFNNVCRTCHTTKPGDNRLGPSLAGIVGRKAGAEAGYTNYSEAMNSADITWDKATLDKFIENPDEVVPGNNMKPFSGVADPNERAKIVDFLASNRGG